MIKIKWILLFCVFLAGYFLRVVYLSQKSLTFGYDQARDAIVSQQILKKDLKIQGPPASTPGLYHGVFYYYLLAPAYFFGQGSPIAAAYWIAFLNAGCIFVVFYLAYLMTKKISAGILAAILFAVSFEATQYATWLSNPTIGVWTVPLMYLGLWLWITKKNKIAPFLAAIGLGLSVQAEVFLLYHLVPLLLWLWLGRKNVSKSSLISFGLMFLATISSMVISEVKFGFKSLSGVVALVSTQDAIVAAKSLGDFILLFFNQLGRVFAFNSYPGNVGYGGVLIIALIVVSLISWSSSKNKESNISWQPFLATWLLAHLTVVSVGGTSTPFLLVGIGPAVAIILGIFLSSWWEKGQRALFVIVLAILLLGNLLMVTKENPRGSTIFAIQKDLLLSKQLNLVDYTYQKAAGRPFSVNSLTSPLWINIVWTYLYKWYGLPKYGYVPTWHGHGQEGQLDSLAKTKDDTKVYFLILEPMGGIPQRYLAETIGEEDSFSGFIEEASWGELRVQYRQKIQK